MCEIVEIENQKLLNDFKQFISSITKQDNIALMYDTDPDGLSASVLVQKSLSKLNLNKPLLISKHKYGRNIPDEMIQELKQNKINYFIAVDLPFESYPNIEKLSSLDILVMDHHPVTNLNVPKNILVIKPQFFQTKLEPSRVCAANVVYTFFSEIIDLKKYDWISAIGMIADITYKEKENQIFIDDVLKKNHVEIKPNPFDTEFGQFVNYVAYADSFESKDELIYAQNALLSSNNYQEAEKKLERFKIVEDEINSYVDNFPKNAEKINNIYFYDMTPNNFIGSIIATRASMRKAYNNILVVIENKNNMLNVSVRCQDKSYDMGRMMNEVTTHLTSASGGGHIPAAGGKVQIQDKDKFKKLVVDWVKNNGDLN